MKDLKSGDWVKVLRKPTKKELQGWNNSWIEGEEDMDSAVGKVLEVNRLSKTGVELNDNTGNYDYPLCILEKAQEPKNQ